MEFIATLVAAEHTDGVSLVLQVLLEAFADKEAELKLRNEELKKVWAFFNSEKNNLLRPDKDKAFYALKEAQSRLDEAWAVYKGTRKKATDDHYEAKRRKHENWRNSVEANLKNNQQKIEKMEGALERKRQHLDELYERLEDARSDSYRERVEGWIEEDSSSIKDIEEQLERVNSWIKEGWNKLNS